MKQKSIPPYLQSPCNRAVAASSSVRSKSLTAIHICVLFSQFKQMASEKPLLHHYHSVPFGVAVKKRNTLVGRMHLARWSASAAAKLFVSNRLQTRCCPLPLLDPLVCELRKRLTHHSARLSNERTIDCAHGRDPHSTRVIGSRTRPLAMSRYVHVSGIRFRDTWSQQSALRVSSAAAAGTRTKGVRKFTCLAVYECPVF